MPAKSYTGVVPMKDSEESRSSTEVEEDSLMGDDEEKQKWRRRQRRHMDTFFTSPQRASESDAVARSSCYRWLITTVLQLIIIGLLGLILLRREKPVAPAQETSQIGSNFNGNGPSINTTILKFNADTTIVPWNASEFFENDVLEQWRTLLPAGAGWGTDKSTFATTTMTHQLHCLFMMARIHAALEAGTPSKLPSDYKVHFMHCIDYLRQGIMCSADLATEPHTPADPDDLGPLDGSWGGLHVCKDYGQVKDYLAQQISDGARVVLPIDD